VVIVTDPREIAEAIGAGEAIEAVINVLSKNRVRVNQMLRQARKSSAI
jgi:hypothetical protein